ncbi:MAG: N-acetylmannosaminyltransferase [Patescibacteria group bacterium]|nr:MAG: N-acetylmannosaminyltransferase [Patescibacteria group bacterium]
MNKKGLKNKNLKLKKYLIKNNLFMTVKKILGITIFKQSKKDILEKIKKYIEKPQSFFHIVSLNPENLVIAQENQNFKKVIETAQIKIIDGVGVVIASRILNIGIGERFSGVDLMKELLDLAGKRRLRVLFIGGKPKLAEKLADCYSKKYPKAKFLGVEGIKDIKNPLKKEEKEIFSIVTDLKPHFVFVAFGSPFQELWIERHKKNFDGCLVMGVGGAFDFLGGVVPRAPVFIQKIGLEWLFRLIVQPWRWRRQLRLIRFLYLVIKEKISNI